MNSPEPQLIDQIWNSLKIAVIIIAVVAPVIIVYLAMRFNRMKKRLFSEKQTNQKLVEKRIEVYDRMGPKLNDIYCFFSYTGNWKALMPMDIMKLKRELDKEISVHMPLFSDDLNAKYTSFMLLCFVSRSGWEHEEKIKSMYELRQENNPGWNDEWISFFDPNNVVEAIRLKERYDDLMDCFRKNLSL